MKWVILVAVASWFATRSRTMSAKFKMPQSTEDPGKSVSRTPDAQEGPAVGSEAALHARAISHIDEMVNTLETKTNLIDRHLLLMKIVDEAYKNRSDPDSAAVLRKVAEMHLSEFPKIKPALKREKNGALPRVITFQKYAMFLTENKEYEKAISVCEQAMSEGLNDGTKSGFEGRIERIKKQITA